MRFKVLLPTFCVELRKLPIPEVKNYRFATKCMGSNLNSLTKMVSTMILFLVVILMIAKIVKGECQHE